MGGSVNPHNDWTINGASISGNLSRSWAADNRYTDIIAGIQVTQLALARGQQATAGVSIGQFEPDATQSSRNSKTPDGKEPRFADEGAHRRDRTR